MSLVGRDTELEAVAGAIGAVRGGESRAVVVTGEPGIGKTSLLAEAAARAGAGGLPAVVVRAVTHEREVPFALAAAVLEAHAGATCALDAVLGRPASAGERFRHHRALSAALAAAAGDRPFALVLDDLQWADEASLEWLVHLLHRPLRVPALLVLAARPGPAALQLVGAARDAGEHVALGPLDHDAALALLDALGDRALAERVAAEAGGNPLFLHELGRVVARDGDELPASIAAAVDRQVADLPEPARELLAAAAVIGDPFDDDVAAVAAGLDDAAAAAGLDALVRADLVRPAGTRRAFAFRHALVRRSVYEALAPARRLALHRAVAGELGRRGAPLGLRAPHVERSAATGDAAAADLLAAAAETAHETAPGQAAAWWETALGLLGDTTPQRRRDLLAARGRALAAAGQLEAALAAFDEADALIHDAATAALAAQVERTLGRTGAARARLAAALAHAQGSDRAELELEMAATVYTVGDVDGAQEHLEAAARTWPGGSAATRTIADGIVVFRRVLAGEAPAEDLAPLEDRALALPERDVREAAGWLGTLAFQCERYRSAARLLERAIDAGLVVRADHLLPTRRAVRALALMFDLRMAEALEESDAAEEGARLQRVSVITGWAASTRALVLELLGRQRESRAAASAALSDLADAEPTIVTTVATSLALAIVHAHDPERVVAEVPPLLGAMLVRVSSLLGPLVEAALATGAPDDARRWIDEVGAGAERHHLQAGRTRVAQARARLALAEGDATAAVAQARHGLDLAQAHALALDATRGRILLGRALAATGDRAGALATLEIALADASRASAELLAAEAARELRAAGLRVGARALRAGAGPGPAELSEREQAIAELVARGHSNKEVAGTLFLSAKTVENNLSRIYAKLGVRSRAELAAVWAVEGDRRGGSPSS